ncbi:MAG TPA: tetratricopeptide repeat protein [Blastocatellia bacterium]|nr:tetratricopeptide repeat protein [Blastocatellia bacterium]
MSLNKSKVLRTAEKYVLQGKIPAAIDEYRKVVDADPADLTTINTLGDLYVRAGKIQDAITNFSRIADSYREGGFTLKAIAMLKKISKLDPTNVETSMKLANLYSQQGLLVEARQQYLQVADSHARAGQTRKALEAYQKIADLDPSNTSVRMKLGEIYSRERMPEQAHESFIVAGAEFLRKGDTEQALNANLKAITINPDSRQALTAIASIYSQQGQTDRAINILVEAFERSPGDVELLTILGRTYLSAGMMDDAERTFLSLVQLDKNRYHYLLEIGRRFLQTDDLDRATEQIDGCLEVLIAKREEDKAIDFLRRVLDKNLNHIGALKRLAQIFIRIREDHNLIATLTSLTEAAMRSGDEEEAIAALKELARLEPDEPMHLQRLYNLGVRDIVEADSPDVVRATGPLDYESAAFDDAFVIRQISEAEILAGHGQVAHAVEMLSEILNHAPENVQVRLKLKDIYLRAGMMDKAAAQCVELARIHDGRGEPARASDYLAEAHQLDPLVESSVTQASSLSQETSSDPVGHFKVETSFADIVGPESDNGEAGFELSPAPAPVDWGSYQTGGLGNHPGFVTVPESEPPSNLAAEPGEPPSSQVVEGVFQFGDASMAEELDNPNASDAADSAFNSASLLASDTMPRVLRDELEGIDFYIAQGYLEIARDTLDRLRLEHGDHPEIVSRYKKMGVSLDAAPAVVEVEREQPEPLGIKVGTVLLNDLPDVSTDGVDLQVAGGFDMSLSSDYGAPDETVFGEPTLEAPSESSPFLVHKESGPLYQDLLVQLNTSDLREHAPFEGLNPQSVPSYDNVEQQLGTADLIDSLISNISNSIEGAYHSESPLEEFEPEPQTPNGHASVAQEVNDITDFGLLDKTSTFVEQPGVEQPVVEQSGAEESIAEKAPEMMMRGDELKEIFEELRENFDALTPLIDFETHFSLGLAYKDMELLDEAIGEFQMAFRMAGVENPTGDYIHCCNMLGVCFKRKQMPKVAVRWFERGLKIPNRPEDEYQALRYEIGVCYEEIGEVDKAIDVFLEVYGIDVTYRGVAERIAQLQGLKSA